MKSMRPFKLRALLTCKPAAIRRLTTSRYSNVNFSSTHRISSTLSDKFTKPFSSSTSTRVNSRRANTHHIVRANFSNDPKKQEKLLFEDNFVVYGASIALTSVIILASKFSGDILENIDAWNGFNGFAAGDIAGALLWSISYYFVSPLQLLLLFLGKIETERPSDWLMYRLGKIFKLDVDALAYQPPLPIFIATLLFILTEGFLTTIAFQALLGDDATWAVSTGIGACFAACVYEVGRPETLSKNELESLEIRWQDFAAYADEALEKNNNTRVHESEIFQAFRRQSGKYRTQESLSDTRLRDMIKNWHPSVSRSRTGWYKGISFKGRGNGSITQKNSGDTKSSSTEKMVVAVEEN